MRVVGVSRGLRMTRCPFLTRRTSTKAEHLYACVRFRVQSEREPSVRGATEIFRQSHFECVKLNE